MPCDTGIVNGELIEYNDVLAELKQLMICSSSEHVVIAGDLNTDLSRDNAQTKALVSFVNEEKCVFVLIMLSLMYLIHTLQL